MKIIIAHTLSAELKDELQTKCPKAELIIVDKLTDAQNDLANAEIIYASRFNTELLNASPKLKFLQAPYAGMNSMPLSALEERGVLLANARIHGETISELVLGMMIALSRNFPLAFKHQADHSWTRLPQQSLQDATIAIVGVGVIGSHIAKRASAFGMKVLGFSRSGKPVEYVDESHTTDELLQEIGRADYVVVACPLTPETHKMIDATVFEAMKKTSFILNIGRGPIIDELAMIAALEQGEIAGAGLDVFDIEPLPQDSPLWDMSNVLCFPHVAGSLDGNDLRAGRIFVDNVLNYLEGKPLRCAVDLKLGY